MRRPLLAAAGGSIAIFLQLLSFHCAHAAPPRLTFADFTDDNTIDSVSISPDGRRVAYRILSPSLVTNRNVAIWKLRNLALDEASIAVGNPTEPSYVPLFTAPEEGVSAWGTGNRTLYALAAGVNGVQVHKLGANGFDKPVTDDAADVKDFELDPVHHVLRYHVGSSRSDIAAALRTQSEQGIHLDRTIVTDGLRLTDNFRIGTRLTTIRQLEWGGKAGEPYNIASRSVEIPIDGALSSGSVAPGTSAGVLVPIVAVMKKQTLSIPPSGIVVNIEMLKDVDREALGERFEHYAPVARLPNGRVLRCWGGRCPGPEDNLRAVFVNPARSEIDMLVVKGQSGISRIIGWDPRTARVRTIYSAGTLLDGGARDGISTCSQASTLLVCVESAPNSPERLVRINLNDGHRDIIDDPNTEVRSKTFAPAKSISWRDSHGRLSYGVLVLPPQKLSKPAPLVITTYTCQGFLRGGTAWLAPEQMLAQRGIAALCANTNYSGWGTKDKNGSLVPLAAHKAYVDALASIISLLSRRKLIDPARVGVTGHSFSSMMVAYAISHTSLFKAAVIGGAFDIDPIGYSLTAPTADSWRKDSYAAMGLPKPTEDPQHIWSDISPSKHASTVSAALLMQPPESEYAPCLQLFSRLQDLGIPTDMYIYPNEGHMVGIEPLHQYWRNIRSIDWFAFWLLGHESRTSDTADQFDRWEALRKEDRRLVPDEPSILPDALPSHDEAHASTSISVRRRE